METDETHRTSCPTTTVQPRRRLLSFLRAISALLILSIIEFSSLHRDLNHFQHLHFHSLTRHQFGQLTSFIVPPQQSLSKPCHTRVQIPTMYLLFCLKKLVFTLFIHLKYHFCNYFSYFNNVSYFNSFQIRKLRKGGRFEIGEKVGLSMIDF